MPRSIILCSSLLLALLSYKGLAEAQATTDKRLLKNPLSYNDIRFDEEPVVTGGSGSGTVPYSDDEDFGESGSGSGSGQGDTDSTDVQTTPKAKITTMESTTTTKTPLSACEKMRKTGLMFGRKAIPNCVDDVYGSTQCTSQLGRSDCWCSDKIGKTIPGTVMEPPNVPDCDFGSNLSPCLYQLVTAMRGELLGSPRPQCTKDGQFHPVQCTGSVCYCVDKDSGITDSSTIVHRPDIPLCSEDTDKETDTNIAEIPTDSTDSTESSKETEEPIKIEPNNETVDTVIPGSEEPTDIVPTDENFNIDTGIGSDVKDVVVKDDDTYENNKLDLDESEENEIDEGPDDSIKTNMFHDKETKIKAASPIMAQPGLLAGVIGGALVLALCLVLLIMFIIYRMRKKDEGSYPLDEPRKPPKYPYMRAPEREFYA